MPGLPFSRSRRLPTTTRRPGGRRRALSVTALALALAFQVQTAQAEPVAFDIPAQPLASALADLARQANLQLAFAPALAEGRQAPAVSGSLEVDEALRSLLAGSGLQGRLRGRTLVVEAIDAPRTGTVLPAVTVSAQAERNGTTEGTDSYTTRRMSTATGLAMSPRETPQSVSVLSRQQMDDGGLLTLDDAVQSITGLVMQKGNYVGDSGSFSARGFEITNLLLDGLPTTLGANGTFNANNDSLDIYDRVEVVRGATGLTTGAGTPSAAINLVRKRPTAERQTSLSLSAGSWNNYRLALDAGGPLNAAGTLRGRAVITAQDSRQFHDVAHDRSQQLYGILEADLGRATVATLGYHYRRVDNKGNAQSLPVQEDGRFYPGLRRSTYLGNAFDYWKQTDHTVFADLTHHFANGWQARLAVQQRRPDLDMMDSGAFRNEGVLRQSTQRYRLDNVQNNYDLALRGPFTLLGRSHELMLGASYRKHENTNWGGWADYAWSDAAPAIDPYHWNPSAVPQPDIDMDLWQQIRTIRQKSVYAATRLRMTDPLTLILGGRLNWYAHDQHEGYGNDFAVNREFTPYAGLVHDLNETHSVYASWTEIFEPQLSAVDASGSSIAPITGTNYEAGIKGEYLDGRLNASLAVFLIKQQNRAVDDLNGPNPCPGATFGYCQRAAGEVQSKGLELEVAGALTADWQIMAGYTYVKNEFTRDADLSLIGRPYNGSLPRHQFKLATSYRLPFDQRRWRIGGNLLAQSRSFSSWDGEQLAQGSYAIVGLNGAYAISAATELRLNVYNLFDRRYYRNVGWDTGGNVFGTPRSVLATLQHRF